MPRVPRILKFPNRGRVRCLGPGKEHYFHSIDKARFRVCSKCRFEISKIGPSARPHIRQRPRWMPV